jgi:predicted amidohydrolase YtcJ
MALLGFNNLWPAMGLALPSNPEAKQDCDLLIKGGTVIDPVQSLHSPLDVAVKNGKILQLSPDIPVSRARTVVSTKGKIVTPGFIDIRVHIFEGFGALGVNADHEGPQSRRDSRPSLKNRWSDG